MRSHIEHAARRWWIRCLTATLFLGSWIGLSGMAWGQIVRVEEDWEMVVSEPDPGTDGPQVTCVFSPVGNASWLNAHFEVNVRTLPRFAPGGLQLQLWYGEQPIYHNHYPNTAVMSTSGETVRWTQAMALGGGLLSFEVVNGQSTTWGPFGGQGCLKASVATGLTDLSGYSPSVSAANSAIGYAGNRVESLVLKRVRLISDDDHVVEDDTPRYVHAGQ